MAGNTKEPLYIDERKIKAVLENKDANGHYLANGGQIEEETGISKQAISKYRTGKVQLENMSVNVAQKLTQFYMLHMPDLLLAEERTRTRWFTLAYTYLEIYQEKWERLDKKHSVSRALLLLNDFAARPATIYQKVFEETIDMANEKHDPDLEFYLKKLDTIISQIALDDFNDTPLDATYPIIRHATRYALHKQGLPFSVK